METEEPLDNAPTTCPPVTLEYVELFRRVGTKAVVLVMSVDRKVPFKTW